MPDPKQLYTVKRIETGEPRNSTGAKPAVFEILGPGAPDKPIASEPIAIMIRDALEEAGQILVKQTIAKCKNEVLERNPVEPFKIRDALRIEHPLTGLPSDIHLMTGDEVNIATGAYRAALAQVDAASAEIIPFDVVIVKGVRNQDVVTIERNVPEFGRVLLTDGGDSFSESLFNRRNTDTQHASEPEEHDGINPLTGHDTREEVRGER